MSVETLRKEIQALESDIEGLEERIKTKKSKKATVAAQVQARIFLERIFAPYMDGLCDTWGMKPAEGLKLLIKRNDSLYRIAYDNREALDEFLSQPEVKVIKSITKPLESVSDEWIKDKMSVLLDVMVKIRPELANVIMTTPDGEAWFHDSLVGLRNLLFGIPQLNIETP